MMEPTLVATLRGWRSARPSASEARCDLCGAGIGRTHDHLAEPEKGRILCACLPCTLLFPSRTGSRLKRVPRQVRALPEVDPEDELWAGLGVPVGLAFFFSSSVVQRMVAVYPGPAGPTTATVDPEACPSPRHSSGPRPTRPPASPRPYSVTRSATAGA